MDKREDIFCAAMGLFNQNGFDNTPTSLIAREAGVATGTLFHHFKTKEDLINRLYLRCKEHMVRSMMEGIGAENTYRSKVKRVYMNCLKWGMDFSDEFLFFQQFCNSVYIFEMTRKEGWDKFGPLREILREGMEKEFIRKGPEEYILSAISALMTSNISYFIRNRDMMENEEFVESTFLCIWNSMKL